MRPIIHILIFAAALRIISAVYSEGYLMHDDHFWVVNLQLAGLTITITINGFPNSGGIRQRAKTSPHKSFYSSLHYLYFEAMNFIGLESPMNKMLVLRLIHGALSLIAVYLSYLIAEDLEAKNQQL